MQNKYITDLVKKIDSQYGYKNINENIELNDNTVIDWMEENSSLNKYSVEQRDILSNNGNMCILACAGAGKTTTTINLIMKRLVNKEIKNPEKVVYTTFSKTGATEMQSRLDDLFKTLGGYNSTIKVRTLHSFFYSILREFGVNGALASTSDRIRMLKEICKEEQYKISYDSLEDLEGLISFQINNLMSAEQAVRSTTNTIEGLDVDTYKEIFNKLRAKKQKEGKIDFDDMQYILWMWLVQWKKSDDSRKVEMSKGVKSYCLENFKHYFIDEAQDMSKLQYEIIKEMVTNDDGKVIANIVIIGDDDQTIYSWRGSNASGMMQAKVGLELLQKNLSTNYRCRKNIVNFARSSITMNKNRLCKDIEGHKDGGTIKIHRTNSNLYDESKRALDIIRARIAEGVNPRDIVVLSRNNETLAILENMLVHEGMYCKTKDNMTLTHNWIFNEIKTIMNFRPSCKSASVTSESLWRLCRFMGRSNSKELAQLQVSLDFDNKQFIEYTSRIIMGSDVTKFNVPNSVELQIRGLLMGCSDATKQCITEIYDIFRYDDESIMMKDLIDMYVESSEFMYRAELKKKVLDGVVKYVESIIDEFGIDKALDYFRVCEQYNNGKKMSTGDTVELSTIHGAKGKEWKHVIALACESGLQPSITTIDLMERDSLEALMKDLEEERRLYYVEMTRAIDSVDIISGPRVSPFVGESINILDEEDKANENVIEWTRGGNKYLSNIEKINKALLEYQ